MLRWFRRAKGTAEANIAGHDRTDDVVALVRYVAELIPPAHRSESVFDCVAKFLALPRAEQEQTFPEIYLLLEQYLMETDPRREQAREALRWHVREHYGVILRFPHILPIFQTPREQELFLSTRLLAEVLDRAFEMLGAKDDNLFSYTREWIARVPGEAALPVPFGVTEVLPETHTEWVALLRTISHKLYGTLEHALGQSLAGRMYQHAYDELAALYLGLDTFPVIIEMLPDTLLDEEKIRLLSRSQMQRVLLEKTEHLQRINDQLTLRNQELELARRELQAAKEDLERRVEERTEQLHAEAAERKLAVEAQRDAERRFQSVVESLGEGIIITDLDDVILYVNSRMAELTGYAPEEMVGKRAYELLLPDSERHRASQRMNQRRRGGSERYVVQLRRKDGSLFWCEVNAQPYRDHEGNIIGTLGTNTDVTSSKQVEEERERLEEQIRHAQKLEGLGVLAGGIAHDFNNLLTSMLGHAALAHRKLPPDSPAQRNIEQIETAAQRAADLTKQMLAYSGKGQFVVQPVNLTEVVQEMTHLLHTVISKKARLHCDFPKDVLTTEGDPGQIRQVVLNLITNASDALGENSGTISLSTGSTRLTPSQASGFLLSENLTSGEYVFVEVTDTGYGMDAETKARMFEPFFSTKFAGRGLGLAAVLGIVRGHGGAIGVESEPGRGTTIRVLFPAFGKPEERLSRPVVDQQQKWRGSGTFLVVDDEKYVRIIAKTILEEVGFTVITATDGREGLEMFREHSDEVVGVLLDMTMPLMSGDEVFQEIRKSTPDVPVILSSGYNEEDTVRRFDDSGRAGFIQKPYQPQALVEKVREVLGQ